MPLIPAGAFPLVICDIDSLSYIRVRGGDNDFGETTHTCVPSGSAGNLDTSIGFGVMHTDFEMDFELVPGHQRVTP